MSEKEKPIWWPDNPYPESIFPMLREEYSEVVTDPKTRTALSEMLGREFWDIADKSIWDAMQANEEELQIEIAEAVKKAVAKKLKNCTCPNCGFGFEG